MSKDYSYIGLGNFQSIFKLRPYCKGFIPKYEIEQSGTSSDAITENDVWLLWKPTRMFEQAL